MLTDPIDLKFTVSSPARLKLDNVSGSVVVQAAEEDEIHIFAVKRQGTGDFDHTKIECTQAEDGTVFAATKMPDLPFSILGGYKICDVDYLVKVPVNTAAEIKVVSSDVKITGTSGDLNIKCVSGDVQLESISGNINIDSVSGDVVGKELSDSLLAKTVSGDVNLVNSNLGQLKFYSTSGDLAVEASLGDGPHQFKTVSGDVILKLNGKSDAEVILKTLSGTLRTDFPVQKQNYSQGRQSVVIGQGKSQVSMSSVSGDLRIVSTGEKPEKPSANISDIISRIDNGELTVEQALEQLSG